MTIILNDNATPLLPEAIALTIRSIFPKDDHSQIRKRLLSAFEGQSIAGGYDQLVLALQEALVQLANEKPYWEPPVFDAMHALALHSVQTVENRGVYVTGENRPNPNAVFWPDPSYKNQPRSTFTELPYANVHRFVDRSTPIGSMGSCFALEIAHRLQSSGFNYVVTEKFAMESETREKEHSDACAAWGTIFNVPAMRQLLEKAFGKRVLPKLLFEDDDKGRKIYCDPFREGVWFYSIEEYEKSYESHIEACRQAFLKTKVFIATLGLNEVWYLRSDNSVLSRCPWKLAASLIEKRIVGVQETIQELQTMLDLWRSFNPEIKLIVSVSPVPLHATFRGNSHHVIAANCHSKSTLRVAAEDFIAANENVYYFPSYEKVMYCTENPWEPDQRHVARSTVDGVMKLFAHMFVKEVDADYMARGQKN